MARNHDREAIQQCDHYYAWVSPAGTRAAARICMLCHQPDSEWLNHVIEVDQGHANCLHCEFADPVAVPDKRQSGDV